MSGVPPGDPAPGPAGRPGPEATASQSPVAPTIPVGALRSPGDIGAEPSEAGGPLEPGATLPPPPSGAPAPRQRRSLATMFQALGFERPSRWLGLLLVAIVVDAVVIAWLQVQAYNAFYTFSQDFGSFNQSFYTAAFQSQLFTYTSNLPAGTGGTYFAVHFAPFLFLLVPFYALFASPPTLLVFKAIALALGALPVYGLAHRRLGSPIWGFGLGLAYLLSPITMDLAWTSFDMEVFLPVLVLTTVYFLTRRRFVPFLVFLLLSLSVIETIAPLLVLFLAVCLLGAFMGPKAVSASALLRERVVLLSALFLAVIWILLAYIVTTSLDPVGATFGGGYASRYTTLGATTFSGVVPQALLHPNLAGAALSYQGSDKAAYVLLLFGSLAFLPLFGELRYLLPIGGWLTLSLLSNTSSLYTFGSSYLGYVDPFLFAGAIGGIVYLRRLLANLASPSAGPAPVDPASPHLAHRRRAIASDSAIPVFLALAVLVSVGVANPLLADPADSLGSLHFGFPVQTEHDTFLHRVIGLIPANASVLTTAHVFPEVSERGNAYVLPSAELFVGNNTYWGYLNHFINESGFVLLDFSLDGYVSQLMQYFGNYSGFGVLVDSDGVLLLERGWTGGPLPSYWQGSAVAENATGASVAVSPATEQRLPSTTLFYTNHGKVNGPIWSGPGISRISPGEYQATLSYALTSAGSGPLVKFEVTSLPFSVVPTTYLNSSTGHHYTYSFVRGASAQVLASTELSPGTGSIQTASLIVNVSSLQSLTTLGSSVGGTFSLQVYFLSIVAIGPVTVFEGG